MSGFKQGESVRLKLSCPGSHLPTGTTGEVVRCSRRNKLHFHAYVGPHGAADDRSADWLHDNKYTCNNPERWERLKHLGEIFYAEPGRIVPVPVTVDSRAEDFFEKLRDHLDDLFPKHQCKERGAALVLFAQANILFNEYINK